MKKAVSLLICAAALAALLCVPAAAETDLSAYSISNGAVRAAAFADVTAPCSGVLLPFDREAGDAVQAGDALFALRTTRVTAPEDGVVRCVFAEVGDNAGAVMGSYGSVMALEPARALRIHATYLDAADHPECEHVHVGQTLYFEADHVKGTGRVIYTEGYDYEVEILTGEYDVNESLNLYLEEERSYRSKTGMGWTYKRDDLGVAATGVVAEIPVSVGDTVKKGDVLMTLLPGDADVGTAPTISAPASGVLSQVAAVSGQQVYKGQLLARISLTDRLEITADVDEMDLRGVKVGDRVPVTLDTDEANILTGTVTEISGLGVPRQNAAYFTVHLTVDEDQLMLGQSASVYLPK